MTHMLCPLCHESIAGGGIDELSQTLTGHLRGEHRMTVLAPPDEGKVVRPSYDAHDKNSVGTRWADPGEGSHLVPDRQEVTDYAVRCPFCQVVVEGRSENDLASEVGEHWSKQHGIRPRRWPSRAGGQGEGRE